MEEDEKIYKQLNKLKSRIMNDEQTLKYLNEKNVLILFGTTGSGKSTLANAFIKGTQNIQQMNGLYEVIEDAEYNGEKIF